MPMRKKVLSQIINLSHNYKNYCLVIRISIIKIRMPIVGIRMLLLKSEYLLSASE